MAKQAQSNKGPQQRSSQPGTVNVAGKKEPKAKRAVHPLVGNDDVKVYPFKSTPGDFDWKSHKPLKKKDFASDDGFFIYKAEEFEAKAKAFRTQAEEAKKMGSTKDRAKAKRLVKMQEKMAELMKQLQAQGIDTEALLATAGKKDEE